MLRVTSLGRGKVCHWVIAVALLGHLVVLLSGTCTGRTGTRTLVPCRIGRGALLLLAADTAECNLETCQLNGITTEGDVNKKDRGTYNGSEKGGGTDTSTNSDSNLGSVAQSTVGRNTRTARSGRVG